MSGKQRKGKKLWGKLGLDMFTVVEAKVMMNSGVNYGSRLKN